MTCVSNILRFRGRPFSQAVEVYTYDSLKEASWSDFKWQVRSLRSVMTNRRTPIVQDFKSIITSKQLDDDSQGSLGDFSDPRRISLSAGEKHGQDMLRRLLGEAVAVFLRNYKQKMWLVEEIANAVFDVSDPVEVPGFGQLEVFEGYRYSPLVIGDGAAGLIVDPKYKFMSRDTLRNLYDRGEHEQYLEEGLEYSPFRDTCPVSACPERTNPYALCTLAGTGKTVDVDSLDSHLAPSDVSIDHDGMVQNIIEYSSERRTCPRTPLLAEAIENSPPVACVYFRGDAKVYQYPLERIRVRPSFRYLDDEQRRKVMKLVQPDAPERYALTERFFGMLQPLSYPNLPQLVSESSRTAWTDDTPLSLNRVQPAVAKKKRVRFPHQFLPSHGPADLDDSRLDKLDLVVVWSKEPTKQQKRVVHAIFDGSGTSDITTFAEYFRGRSSSLIGEYTLGENSVDDVVDAMVDLRGERRNVAVLLGCEQTAPNRHDCRELEQKLILRDIPKQGFSPSLLQTKSERRQESYFRNIYLGLYAKIGGQAWVLPWQEDESTLILGYSSSAERDSVRYSMCVYTTAGRFLRGLHTRCSRDEHSDTIFRDLCAIKTNEAERLLFIARGSLYQFEKESLENAERAIGREMLVVESVESPVRLYEAQGGRILAPTIGRGIRIDDEELAIVTTIAPTGTAAPIVLRKVMGRRSAFESSVQLILDLTQCYTGYERFTTKHPVPIHSSSRALNKATKLNLGDFQFRVPWFI